MIMKKSFAAPSPQVYLAGLDGWILRQVVFLREAVIAAAPVDEGIKWGHLVYHSNGPVLLIRAEARRVLFGFWRGKLLRNIEPRLVPSGKYELATMTLLEDTVIELPVVDRLVKAAVRLNRTLGNPQQAAG
jgi:hypothetical protein